jgi:hypothetical protein
MHPDNVGQEEHQGHRHGLPLVARLRREGSPNRQVGGDEQAAGP